MAKKKLSILQIANLPNLKEKWLRHKDDQKAHLCALTTLFVTNTTTALLIAQNISMTSANRQFL